MFEITRRALPYAAVALSVLADVACQPELPGLPEPRTGAEWVAASARAHDPEGLWPRFAAEVTVGNYDEAGRFGWQEELYFDRAVDTFRRRIIIEDHLLEQTMGPGGRCRARWPHPNPSEAQRVRLGLSGDACLAILPPRQFNEFLTGLPMSALGERTRFGESPQEETLDGERVVVVTLTFAEDPGGQRWHLLIDPVSKWMRAVRFDSFNGSGEWIYYEAPVTFGGLRLATRRRITRWPSDRFVIEQRLLLEPVP